MKRQQSACAVGQPTGNNFTCPYKQPHLSGTGRHQPKNAIHRIGNCFQSANSKYSHRCPTKLISSPCFKKIPFSPPPGDQPHRHIADAKKALLRGLKLQVVNPDRPYVLQVDASSKAVGAELEQHPNAVGRPTPENSKPGMTVPVAFMSRELTDSQQRVWDVREKEAYAILLAFEKWSSWIGLQPVLIISDHETLKSWAREHLQVPAGPTGRRARWHQRLSRYDITVAWIPWKENVAVDALSR
jgi:hypothetical protein